MYYTDRLAQLKQYNFTTFKADLLSGLIVALVALPLAMSFAISIDVKPEYGLYAAIIGGLVAALFGGSEFNVTGPTGAFVAILSGIVFEFGYQKLLIAGFLAGIILLLAGLFRMGKLIEFIPHPVIIGFTAGIAVIIFTSQLGNIFGLTGLAKHEYFHQNMVEIFSHLSGAHWQAVAITILTVLIMIFLPKLPQHISKYLPAALIAITVSAIVGVVLHLPLSTIQSVFGGIPRSLPHIAFPEISFTVVRQMLPAAFVIAMLGSIESLLSCVVSDGMTRKKHNSNAELIGQGLANIIVPLFGGIPVTGAIARTAVNVKSGAQTRFSAEFHALFLLAIMVLFASLVNYIPLAALGGVLAVVSFRMADLKQIKDLIKHSDYMDVVVLLITFFLTVFLDITISITVGLVLASLLFMRRMTQLQVSPTIINRDEAEPEFVPTTSQLTCPHIMIYTIDGPLFFGAARKFASVLSSIQPAPALILRLKHVSIIDASGLNALWEIIELHKDHSTLYLSGIQPHVLESLDRYGIIDLVGSKHIFHRTSSAINTALKEQGFKDGCEEYKIV